MNLERVDKTVPNRSYLVRVAPLVPAVADIPPELRIGRTNERGRLCLRGYGCGNWTDGRLLFTVPYRRGPVSTGGDQDFESAWGTATMEITALWLLPQDWAEQE